MLNIFPPHATDFYKTGHIKQYPKGTTFVYSNFTCRSSKWANVLNDFDNKVVFFGLQGFLQYFSEWWDHEFFDKPLEEVFKNGELLRVQTLKDIRNRLGALK